MSELAYRHYLPMREAYLASLDDPVALRVQATGEMLDAACRDAELDLDGQMSILDWGAGSGESTQALLKLAEVTGSSLEAIELIADKARKIIDRGILPAERVYRSEGLAFLRDRPEKYDLITAFRFGPDRHGNLALNFLNYAQRSLREGGQMLVTSDEDTMAAFRMVCGSTGVRYSSVEGFVDLLRITSEIVVITK